MSQPMNRESRPASRKTGLADLLQKLLLRVVLGREGTGIQALHANHFGTGDNNKLVDQLDEFVNHVLIPLFGNTGFPTGAYTREHAWIGQAVKLVIQNALPDAVIRVSLHQFDCLLHGGQESSYCFGVCTFATKYHQDWQVVTEAHLVK